MTRSAVGRARALLAFCIGLLAACADDPAPPAPLEGVLVLPGKTVGITDPTIHTDPSKSSVAPDSLVLGVTLGDAARAYRVAMLEGLHVVNDRLGGEPIAVTWCQLCATGAVFHARVEGHPRLTFTTNEAWGGIMLMRDAQTGSRWRQLDGLCVDGPLHGTRLRRVASSDVSRWRAWHAAHPATTLLAAEDEDLVTSFERMARDPARSTMPAFVEETLPTDDDYLPNREPVIGLVLEGKPFAWSLARLAEARVHAETWQGVPLVVIHDAQVPTARVFDARFDGRTLTFERRGDHVHDTQTGSRWSVHGRAVEGELVGMQLTLVPSTATQWYAWRFTHPDTTLRR